MIVLANGPNTLNKKQRLTGKKNTPTISCLQVTSNIYLQGIMLGEKASFKKSQII